MIGIFGAIGWHTLARPESKRMDMVINGAGYDIALAFASLQIHTSFASAINAGKTSELMRMDLEEHGLEDLLLRINDLPFSGSVALQENERERIIRAHPAFDADYPISYLEHFVSNVSHVIAELGFQESTLHALERICSISNKPIIWIARDENDWIKIASNSRWQRHSLFAGPHAYTHWAKYIQEMPQQKDTGFATISENGDTVMLWHGGARNMLPLPRPTTNPEYRFANIVAAVVNEMTAWGQNLCDAANSCSGAFEEWTDIGETGGADLERKVATFYKKVESLEHDALTGLLTRGTAEKILAGKQLDLPLSMIIIDVDHFKRVNDTLGHHKGDEVLTAVAHRISRETRGKDIAVRWGGEEFVILLPGCPEARAVAVAERVRLSLHHIRTELGHVTASFGVAEKLPNEPQNDWFVRVDSRLYVAKKSGRDRVIAGEDAQA